LPPSPLDGIAADREQNGISRGLLIARWPGLLETMKATSIA
jgi:hypothetical protein